MRAVAGAFREWPSVPNGNGRFTAAADRGIRAPPFEDASLHIRSLGPFSFSDTHGLSAVASYSQLKILQLTLGELPMPEGISDVIPSLTSLERLGVIGLCARSEEFLNALAKLVQKSSSLADRHRSPR